MEGPRGALVPATDRAFLYGDGVFETLLVVNGVALWPELHLDRLMRGAKRLKIEVCRQRVNQSISDHLELYSTSAGVLRITVSRNAGDRGYALSKNVGARITAAHAPLARDPFVALAPATVITSSITMAEQPLLAGLKHCNRLEQVMAATEARDSGVDDVLMRRSDGAYQCSSNANLFVLLDGILQTPDCDRSGVSGTRRRLILETFAEQLGIGASAAALGVEELQAAEAMFLCNSIMGVRSIAQWDSRVFEPSDTVAELQREYFQELRQCCAA